MQVDPARVEPAMLFLIKGAVFADSVSRKVRGNRAETIGDFLIFVSLRDDEGDGE